MNSHKLYVFLITCAVGGAFTSCFQCEGVSKGSQIFSEKQCKLKSALRTLWAEHVFWTRQYIVSTLADLKDAKAALDRLLKNQQDLGDAIVPYYGQKAGKQLAKLLTEHIVIAGDVVAAAKKDDKKALKASDEKWHKNARDIAKFLSDANENWPYQALVDMLNMHLKLTTQEAVLRLKQEWAEDVKNFDEIFKQARGMADTLTQGIIKQFPDKF